MNFTHYDLGNLDKGRMVEIILQGNAANVQLLDSSNFNNYRNGRQYRYIGGLAKKSPIRLQTTHTSSELVVPLLCRYLFPFLGIPNINTMKS